MILLRILQLTRSGPAPLPADWTVDDWNRWAIRTYANAASLEAIGIKPPPLGAPWIPEVADLIDEALRLNRRLTALALALRADEAGLGIDVSGPWGARAARLGATAADEPAARERLSELVWYELAARTSQTVREKEDRTVPA